MHGAASVLTIVMCSVQSAEHTIFAVFKKKKRLHTPNTQCESESESDRSKAIVGEQENEREM